MRLKKSQSNTDLYHEILDKDLIAAKFKFHEECRKNLTRSNKEMSINQRGNPSGDFSKVASYIDKFVLSMHQAVGWNALIKIYFDKDCDCLSSTMRKRRSRLKIRLLSYYGDQIMKLETKSNSSAVATNSASVKPRKTTRN